MNGAYQLVIWLTHFVTKTKDDKLYALMVRPGGAIDCLTLLFIMTDEHETSAKHIIEAIHRFINDQWSSGPFPTTLYVQIDNCTRETKNRYLFVYLQKILILG